MPSAPIAIDRLCARIFLAAFLALPACSAAFAQQIACPQTGNVLNLGYADNDFNNGLGPCEIESGATFENLGDSASLTNTDGSTLTVDSGAVITNNQSSGLVNNGTLANNGRINDSGTMLNGGGAGGGTLNNGGIIEITDTGMLTNAPAPTAATINNLYGGSVLNFGEVTNGTGSTINSAGTITNAGTFTNFGFGTITNFGGSFYNVGTFDGSSGQFNNFGTLINYTNETFTNGLLTNGGTTTNYGTFDSSDGNIVNTGSVVNNGVMYSALFENNPGATLTNSNYFSSSATLTNAGTITNTGTFLNESMLTNSGTITNSGAMTNSGILNIQAGGSLTNLTGGIYTQMGGQTIVNGTLTSASALQINFGVLSGTGTINADVNNTFGTVQPGDAPGTLTINGNYTQGSSGTLIIDLGGSSDFSVLDVTGLMTLAGTLDLTAVDGFTPEAGDDFKFLLAGDLSGDFSNINLIGWTCPVGDTCMDLLGPNGFSLDITSSNTTPGTGALHPAPICHRSSRAAGLQQKDEGRSN